MTHFVLHLTVLLAAMPRDDPDAVAIKVSQWQTIVLDEVVETSRRPEVRHAYTFSLTGKDLRHLTDIEDETLSHASSGKQSYPLLSSRDLWDEDSGVHECTRDGYFMTPNEIGVFDVSGGDHSVPAGDSDGEFSGLRKRCNSFDPSQLSCYNTHLETNTIKERLHGWVRPNPDPLP